jgi:hypothetical protein
VMDFRQRPSVSSPTKSIQLSYSINNREHSTKNPILREFSHKLNMNELQEVTFCASGVCAAPTGAVSFFREPSLESPLDFDSATF